MRDCTIARLVYDGGQSIELPIELGHPSHDQLQGTITEQLVEIAGRTCYDSFGSGRDSATYHKHLLEVEHRSVHEHVAYTLEFTSDNSFLHDRLVDVFINRPGCWYRRINAWKVRVTMNLRSILEWDAFTQIQEYDDDTIANETRDLIFDVVQVTCPQVVPYETRRAPTILNAQLQVVAPETEDEQWVSLFLAGSRGFSHEQVRHGDFSAISQRSTRFVDETETAWIIHPVIEAWRDECRSKKPDAVEWFAERHATMLSTARWTYDKLVGELQRWLETKGVDKTSARKQARGAARGYLGNGLYTEMIFSASVRQWKRMLRQRASRFADAEIRQVYADDVGPCVFTELLKSRYAPAFCGWTIVSSPDGIGSVVLEPGK